MDLDADTSGLGASCLGNWVYLGHLEKFNKTVMKSISRLSVAHRNRACLECTDLRRYF